MKLTKRQTEILDSALILTADGGIQNLTIRNLADSLGITEPAIYRHFASKTEIVKAMISRFDHAVSTENKFNGFNAVAEFIHNRFALVSQNPPLAKVMFAEELFMNDPNFSELMMEMMHKHKEQLDKYFHEAQEKGEIRKDIQSDMLFRLTFGPVRLLIKQWGMSEYGFDLKKKGDELIETLRKIFAENK